MTGLEEDHEAPGELDFLAGLTGRKARYCLTLFEDKTEAAHGRASPTLPAKGEF